VWKPASTSSDQNLVSDLVVTSVATLSIGTLLCALPTVPTTIDELHSKAGLLTIKEQTALNRCHSLPAPYKRSPSSKQ